MTQKVTVVYTLRRTRRKTIGVEIHTHGEVVVKSPLRTPIYQIETFMRSKSQWIQARLADFTQARASLPTLPGPDWEFFRGEVRPRKTSTKREAFDVFEGFVHELLPELGVSGLRYKELRVRSMKRRWGSCASDGRITLNLHLICLPDRCIKSVVAHELAHLVHMHHGPEFQQLAEQIWSGYSDTDAELDAWTAVLDKTFASKKNGTEGPVEKRIVWL